MARRKRPDYVAPSVRARPVRAEPVAVPAEAQQYFPPGTWKKVLAGGLLGALALGSVSGYVFLSRRADRELARTLLAGTCTTDQRTDPTGGDGHVEDPSFAVDPPSGGDHAEQVAKAGTYAGDAVPDDGRLVHALEHGYVILWHRPDVATDVLREVAADHEDDVIVVERTSLPVPVAATAWESRLLCQEAEATTLEAFVDARVGDGPEDVPRG